MCSIEYMANKWMKNKNSKFLSLNQNQKPKLFLSNVQPFASLACFIGFVLANKINSKIFFFKSSFPKLTLQVTITCLKLQIVDLSYIFILN